MNGWSGRGRGPVLHCQAGWQAGQRPIQGLGLRLVWHDGNSTVDSFGYGQEWNPQVTYPATKRVTVFARFARYDADALATDTPKAGLCVDAKF